MLSYAIILKAHQIIFVENNTEFIISVKDIIERHVIFPLKLGGIALFK